MTRDEIISMAREAGLYLDGANQRTPMWVLTHEELESFAALVAAREREECALIADEWATFEQRQFGKGGPAAAIRARGTT